MNWDVLVLNLFLIEKSEKHDLFKAGLFLFFRHQKYFACVERMLDI